MKNRELADIIIEHVGGEDNISSVAHCMTRLRIKVKDSSNVQMESLKDVDGIMGVVDSDTLQIVVGPGRAKKVYDEVVENYKVATAADTSNWEENKKALKGSQNESGFKKLLKNISNIFIPLIPAIIAAGLFNGFASLIGQVLAPTEGFWFIVQQLFSLFGAGFLSYFAIYTGINAAIEFGGTPAMGGILGGISITGGQLIAISTYLGLYNADSPLNSILTTGKGGIIGVIAGVWIMSKLERTIRKAVPDVLDLIITPFLTILISGTVFVFIIMPLAGFISDGLVAALSVIIDSPNEFVRILSGFLLSALFLPMVLLGLHHGLIPIYAVQLEQLGGVSLFPVLAMAGAGQVGAAIAIYIKAKRVKNMRMEKTVIGALPAGFLGVGEPLIYGVTLPLGKPFITAGLGAGFGGAWVMLSKVTAGAWGPSGLVAIPLMQSPTMMLNYFIGLVIAYIAGFIITYVFIKDETLEV